MYPTRREALATVLAAGVSPHATAAEPKLTLSTFLDRKSVV